MRHRFSVVQCGSVFRSSHVHTYQSGSHGQDRCCVCMDQRKDCPRTKSECPNLSRNITFFHRNQGTMQFEVLFHCGSRFGVYFHWVVCVCACASSCMPKVLLIFAMNMRRLSALPLNYAPHHHCHAATRIELEQGEIQLMCYSSLAKLWASQCCFA